MSTKVKPFPSYGRRMFQRMKTGWHPTNGVNVYTSWRMARCFPHGVCFPPDARPDEFNWTFLAGQDITLINTEGRCDYDTLKKLAVIIIQSGAARVGLVDADHPLEWFVPGKEAQAA